MKHLTKRNLAIAFTLAMLSALISCTEQSPYYKVDKMTTYELQSRTDTIQGDFLLHDSLNDVCGLESCGKYVVILKGGQDGLFSVIDTKNDSIIANLGAIGRANNELMSPVDICQLYKDKGDVRMSVQDYERKSIADFNLSEAVRDQNIKHMERTEYKIDDSNIPVYHAFMTKDSKCLIHQGVSGEGDARDPLNVQPLIYFRANTSSERMTLYPTLVSSDAQLLPHIYTLMPRMKPDRTKFLEVQGLLNQFTIIDLESHHTLGVQMNGSMTLDDIHDLSLKKTGKQIYSDLYICNVMCNVSDNYIFLCQDGKTPMDRYEDILNYRPRVIVFDWTGSLIYSFAVKEPLMRIAYNEENHCLYGIDCNYNLYRYDLRSHL